MPRLWLLFDANNVMARMFFAIREPMLVGGLPTNAIYGFLRTVLTLRDQYQKFGGVNFAFCFDKGESLRKKVWPGYKAKGPAPTADKYLDRKYLTQQLYDLRTRVLPRIGYRNVLACEGYEADDLVAACCSHWSVKRAVIVSSDKDLFQCLEEGPRRTITQYDIGTKQEVTRATFFEKYGVMPSDWPRVKAMAGCLSDNVPGIDGVAEKTAIKYVNQCLPHTSAAYLRITRSGDLIARNELLVTLPYVGLKCPELREDEDDDNSWRSVVSALNMKQLAVR
jgi:5'-3' exonuclease